MNWHPFDNGKSIGRCGSENGTIIRDESHNDGARITLERGGCTAPFAITCGIYGWMVHTYFISTESEGHAAFEKMKEDLIKIMSSIPSAGDPDVNAKSESVFKSVSQFVGKF